MFPKKISPIIPVRRRELFESAEWFYELKHDGFRALAYIADGRCRLISRRGNEMKRFKDLSELLAKDLKATSTILDGEIVALDGTGKPAFYDLMKRQCGAVISPPCCDTGIGRGGLMTFASLNPKRPLATHPPSCGVTDSMISVNSLYGGTRTHPSHVPTSAFVGSSWAQADEPPKPINIWKRKTQP